MSRAFRVLGVVSILLVSAALAAVLIWQQQVHGVALVLGLVFLVIGGVGTTLHLTASDDFLRRHCGEPGAQQMRQFGRSAWVGVVLGAAMLGVHYLDRWVQAATVETQFRAAYNRGRAAAKEQDWQTATDAFSEAIRLDPKSGDAYRSRGIVYGQQGEQDWALADLDEAIRLNPDDAVALYDRGVVYFQKAEYDRALADFGEAIRLKPNYAIAYRARGKVYGKKGDDAQAKADRQKADELAPAESERKNPEREASAP
ncbi:MAG TPA: tetratricopeptide repeat protein [Gemmataceae bacterium]|jgi:tetratricopeptide (TPR) repeat protein